MKQGAIVLTPFPFTDLSVIKRRPALVVSSIKELQDDVVVAFISSKIPPSLSETDYLLEESHKDFADTGLHKTSVIKMDKLVTINKNVFTGELGFVSERILNELLKRLRIVFKL